MSEMKIGDPCRARCSAPARYLGEGRCLFVSSMCNELSEDEAKPAEGNEEKWPLPSDEQLYAYLAGKHTGVANAWDNTEALKRRVKELEWLLEREKGRVR